MATIRHHVTIDRSPDEVWALVSDPTAWPAWFPGMETATLDEDGKGRTVQLAGGFELGEEIVTNDDDLRRFQYRIKPGSFPLEYHLATIDVLPTDGGAVVVYGAEVLPDEHKAMFDGAVHGALDGLKAHVTG